MNTKLKFSILAASCAALVVSSPASARELIYSTFVSPEHHLVKNVVEPFTNAVKERTNGEITFKIYSGGSLAGAKETLASVESGTVDGFIIDIYTPASLPQTALLSDLSLLIDDAVVATAAMNETVLLDCAECRKSFENHNVMPLGFLSTSVYALQCTKPVTSLSDIAGLKVRATGAWAPLMVELGATPVSVPTSELFEGLQRGALDCSVGPIAHLPSYSLYEVVTDVNEMPMGAYAGGLSINLRKDIWDELSAEEKSMMLDIAPEYVAAGVFGYIDGDNKAKEEALSRGINWIPEAQDIAAAYDEYNKAAIANAIEKGKGNAAIGDSEALVNAYVENLKKWSEILKGKSDDQAFVAKALREEIYSKLN